MDIKAFFKLSYGLYIVSSSYKSNQSGCVVNTLSQVTADPPKFSVTISKNSFTKKIIEKSGYFTATVLTKKATMDLIGEFGFKSSESTDKFLKFNTKLDENNIKYVTNHMASRYSFKVIDSLDLETHIMFIGKVLEAEILNNDDVMTYSYYHNVIKGSTPKNAPSYQKEPAKKGYICTVCGYFLDSDKIPDDFICPICKQGTDKFKKI
ncbi:flavin reductase [Clostridium oceanicum]|uniref:Flavin reductase n=1 Tax=Clostridium oceanicum TaxID=1543 RepID=A0ABP3UQ47_9CLOT